MIIETGLEDIQFSNKKSFLCAIGYKKNNQSIIKKARLIGLFTISILIIQA